MIFKKIKDNPKFIGGLKIFSIWLLGILAVLYLSFLFILPAALNLNSFTPQISRQINTLTDFGFELVNPKLQTTWKLGIKLRADKISLKYKDGTNFADLVQPSIEINLPTLLLKHLNLDKIYAKEANVYLVFTKDKKYTLEEHILKILPKEKPQEQQDALELPIQLKNINIVNGSAKLTLKDKVLDKTFVVKANNSRINLASLSGPLKIKTSGCAYRQGTKENFVNFNINLYTKLPDFDNQKNKKIEQAPQFKFDFNPFAGFDLFALRSNLDMDLKITDPGENFKAKGYINLSDITFKINNMQLPKSYAIATFNKNNINLSSQLYISKEEFIKTNAELNLSKKSKIAIEAQSAKITLANTKLLLQSFLDMFAVKNDLKNVAAQGQLSCDFKLKSNFKTVQSSGNLRLIDGNIAYPKLNLNLTKISSYLDFSNNMISIKDTSAYVNGAKFEVGGTIKSDSKLDINVKSDPLKVADIVKLAQQFRIIKAQDVKDYSFNSGTIVLAAIVKGDLQNIIPKADVKLDNLALNVKSMKMPVALNSAHISVEPDKKDFIAKINATGFKASLKNPAFNISAANCDIDANSKTLTLKPFNLNLNGTNANISGTLEDYMNKPIADIQVRGTIHPNTVMTFVPYKNRQYISREGQMPFSAKVNGEPTNLKIQANVTSNPKNYISVVDIKNIRGTENTLNADLVLKDNDLVINSINITSKGTKMASASGKIGKIYSQNPSLSPLNIVIPQKLSISVPAIGKLSLDADVNAAITGSTLSPQISGNANISNLNYPEYKLSVSNAYLDFKKSQLSARADGIKTAGSDFAGDALMLSDFSRGIVISSLNFTSNYIDSDALMKLTASMPNTQVSAGPSINAVIKSGKGRVSKLKSGTMYIENISFDFNLYNNLFKLTNLGATFAQGRITGEASYNVASTRVDIDGVGKSIEMRKAAQQLGINSLILSGSANGMAKLNFRGSTYEQQMRTLNGQIKFDVSNGQYGEAARFERFLHAGNLLTQSLFNFNLNQTISAVTSRNTGEFKKIDGTLSIKNGRASITAFKSTGPNMSLFATGTYNILTENADLKVLGRISSGIVSVLGPLGSFSIDKVFDKLSPKGLAILEAVKSITPANPLFTEISQSDLNKIPPLSASTSNAASKDFQVLINGPISRTASVKSFKWASKEAPAAATLQ